MLKPSAVFLTIAILGVLPNTVDAQSGLAYTTTTRAEFGGSFGRIMRVVPGGTDPVEERTFIQDRKIRVDQEKTSTIMSMDSLLFTALDHEARTYWEMEWGDLGAMWTRRTEGSLPPQDRMVIEDPEDARTVTYDIRFDVDRTGNTERFGEYEGEQVFFTFEMDAIEEHADNPDSIVGGTLVVLTEMWISRDFPGIEALREMRPDWQPAGEADPMALSYDPRIGAAMERLSEEMTDLEGMSLKTISHFVAVPLELDFDRRKVLRDADRSLVADVADAAASSAANSARSRLGGLTGGRLGGRRPRRPDPEQVVIMRFISEIHDVEEGPIDPDVFVRNPDYTLRDPFAEMDASGR